MSVEKRLRDDAESFADEVADFDDEQLYVDIMVGLGIAPWQSPAASPKPSTGPAVNHGRPGRPGTCVGGYAR